MAWSDAARAAAAEARRRHKTSKSGQRKGIAGATFTKRGTQIWPPITRFKAGGSGVSGGGVKRMLGYK